MTAPHAAVAPLLERFAAEIGAVVPVVALWAHGSLALGDFRPGRSDLDLVAVADAELTDVQGERLRAVHRGLVAEDPLAVTLHCAYLSRTDLADAGREHPTWAQGEWFERPVSPVSRRELAVGALALHGPPPAGLLPPVSDAELTGFIREELGGYWLRAAARPELWHQDIWVDLGMLTLARASVTLRDGRLVTKREALDELRALGAPEAVVEDIRRRRYGPDGTAADGTGTDTAPGRPAGRGELARTFVRSAITGVLAR
ncbi:nucleotidyltransferase domain-containing protein [Streptomyces sp. NPDC095613]|uniref:nucleotidyltransferase domain-containing protein n=1 Tax=Streptomyces sp. NPDC095613 TaxID=3155540 RepID=UPI0033181A59